MPEEKFTIESFVRQAAKRLEDLPGLAEPALARREARQLLRQTLGLDLSRQYAEPEFELSQKEWQGLQDIVDRRLRHEPLSAILGRADFYGRSFRLPPGGLAPRPETELLVELGLDLLSQAKEARKLGEDSDLLIAELCCGSGAPGLSLLASLRKKGEDTRLLLLDIDSLAVTTARANAEDMGLAAYCNFQEADLFPLRSRFEQPKVQPAPRADTRFDLILVNPPYIAAQDIPRLMPEVRDYEKILTLDGGEDGLDFYRRLAQGIRPWLKPGAWLIMEHGEGQRPTIQEIFALYAKEDHIIDTQVLDDYAGLDRVLALQYG